jgi:subtilisin family serine protease
MLSIGLPSRKRGLFTPTPGTAGIMTQPVVFPRRRARLANRILRIEPLEVRLALSSASIYPVVQNDSDLAARLAIANVTTSAPTDQFASIVDPAPGGSGDFNIPGPALAEAGPLIGLPAFHSDPRFAGIDGSGYSVVIIDTGIDLDHPFFGPDTDGNGVADRILYNADFADGNANANDLNGHGTHVSSIIASQDATYPGVAPGVGIIHLRVLNASGSGTAASIESALQWVVSHVGQYSIVGVNMSLTFGDNLNSPSTRPEIGITDELAALAAQDVIVASASGNDFFTFFGAPGVSYPSADPNALSVGAVWDADVGGPFSWADGARDNTTGADRIISFSQRHPTMTTVFAPGGLITAAAIGGGTAVLSGTSMATPIVTGVVALMQQLSVQATGHRLSLAQMAAMIRDTGIPIFDGDDEDDNVPNSLQGYYRIDVNALADSVLSQGLSNLTIPGGLQTGSPVVPAGGTARVSFTVANQGATATGTMTTGVYLSTDSVIDASDLLLMEFPDQLSAGASTERSRVAVPIPSGIATGQYYIGVLADNHELVAEGNEGNNSASQPLTVAGDGGEVGVIEVASDQDLAAGSAAIGFGQVIQGAANVEKTFRIYNDGNVALHTTEPVLPAGFAVAGFPASVAPGESVDFTIALLATSSPGSYGGLVSFEANDSDESPFAFGVSGTILEPDDHGNDAAHATSVSVSETVNGRILRTGDVDWFRFAAVEGVRYHFETILQTLADSELRLIDINGTTQLASNDNGPTGLASSIEWVAPVGGEYYLEVSGVGGREGSYQLALTADDDHGNNAATATFASDPSVNVGAIETIGDTDWFSFSTTIGVEYSFETLLTSLAGATMRVFDRDGVTELAVSVGAASGVGAPLHWTAPTTGTYFISIEASSPGSIGAYRLSINAEDDHGDDPGNATPAGIPDSIAGTINDAQDDDVFSFLTTAGAHYHFAVALGLLPASTLRLIGNDETTVIETAVGATGQTTTIDWTAPTAGKFFLEVSGATGATGSYSLELSAADDHGNDSITATATTDPSSNPGMIEVPSDVDWFAFTAIDGVAYRFETLLGTLSAAKLNLIDVDGATILASSGGPGSAARIDWIAPADGQYYLDVSSASGALLGDYRLVVKGDDDHGDNPANATLINIPVGLDGVIERQGDADWFAVDAIPDVEYRIDVLLGALVGGRVRVLGPDGVTELATGIGGSGVPASVTWTATERARYYLEVTEVSFESDQLANNVALSSDESPLSPGGPGGGSYQVFVEAISAIPGDFDGDADVDGADFLVWQRTLGTVSTPDDAPLDSNGFENEAPGPLTDNPLWHQLGSSSGTAVIQPEGQAPENQIVRVDRVYDPLALDPVYGADNWWGVPLGAAAPTGPMVLVAWDMQVSATHAEDGGLGPFFGVQAYDDHGPVIGLLGSLGVDATTLDVVYQREVDGIIVETGVKATPDQWYSYGLLFDFAAHRFTVYFEGRPLATDEFVDLHVDGVNLDRLTDADLIALAAQDNPASQMMPGTAYFDNFRIVTGTKSSLFPADGNGDLVVDGLDLGLWKANFGVSYADPGAGLPGVLASPIEVSQVSAVNEVGPVVSEMSSTAFDAVSTILTPSVNLLVPAAQRLAIELDEAFSVEGRERPTFERPLTDRTLKVPRQIELSAWDAIGRQLPERQNTHTRHFGERAPSGSHSSTSNANELVCDVDAALVELFGG